MTNLTGLPSRDCVILSGGSSFEPYPNTTNNDGGRSTYEAAFLIPPGGGPNAPTTSMPDTRNQNAAIPVPTGFVLPGGVFICPRYNLGGTWVDTNTLAEYPRMHLLSNGHVFMAGWWRGGASVDHELTPGQWDTSVGQTTLNTWQEYNSSILFPISPTLRDHILRVGGAFASTSVDWVESCQASPAPSIWSSPGTTVPNLHTARDRANLAILADGSVLALGGQDSGTAPATGVLTPELYKDGQWHELPDEASIRDYHSTAMLLPDGRVLSASGEQRTFDFQIMKPHYRFGSSFPTNVVLTLPYSTNATAYIATHGQQVTVSCDPLPLGTQLSKVLLMTPGAITHHSDMHQRCIELAIVPDSEMPNAIVVKMPADSKLAPRGYYMAFAQTNHGVPAHAVWVRLL